jgi:hypothetical protein
MTLMDAEWVTYRDLVSGLGARVEAAFTAMKLARPLVRTVGAFPTRGIVDPSWLADPLSIGVLNAALALAVLWAGGFWEPLS